MKTTCGPRSTASSAPRLNERRRHIGQYCCLLVTGQKNRRTATLQSSHVAGLTNRRLAAQDLSLNTASTGVTDVAQLERQRPGVLVGILTWTVERVGKVIGPAEKKAKEQTGRSIIEAEPGTNAASSLRQVIDLATQIAGRTGRRRNFKIRRRPLSARSPKPRDLCPHAERAVSGCSGPAAIRLSIPNADQPGRYQPGCTINSVLIGKWYQCRRQPRAQVRRGASPATPAR